MKGCSDGVNAAQPFAQFVKIPGELDFSWDFVRYAGFSDIPTGFRIFRRVFGYSDGEIL